MVRLGVRVRRGVGGGGGAAAPPPAASFLGSQSPALLVPFLTHRLCWLFAAVVVIAGSLQTFKGLSFLQELRRGGALCISKSFDISK